MPQKCTPKLARSGHAAETGRAAQNVQSLQNGFPVGCFTARTPDLLKKSPPIARMRKRIHQRPFRLSRTSSMTSSSDRSGFQPVKA